MIEHETRPRQTGRKVTGLVLFIITLYLLRPQLREMENYGEVFSPMWLDQASDISLRCYSPSRRARSYQLWNSFRSGSSR